MQMIVLLALVAMGSQPAEATVTNETHPIERVIGLLRDLSAEVEADGNEEAVVYGKFEKWCQDSKKTLNEAIETSKDSIDTLESSVESKDQQNKTLTKQINMLTEELLQASKAATVSKEARDNASALYTTADTELEDTINAIDDAITELEGAKPSALAQTSVRRVSEMPLVLEQITDAERSRLLALASGPDEVTKKDIMARGDSAAHAKTYNFKSNNVIDLLKELKQKFEDDRVEQTKEETNAQNAYNLAKNARDSAVSAAETAKDEKKTLRGEVQQDLVQKRSDLQSARDDLDADTDALRDTKESCETKKSQWNERTELREHEIKAIESAIKILSKATGVSTEPPSNPALPTAPTFLQIVDPRARAVNLLRQEARRAHSRTFERFAEDLAARLATHPFDEVNQMIQKMIFRLKAEQTDEDEHKNWCDLEIEKANASKTNKEEKLEHLDAKIEADKAAADKLKDDIKDADDMVVELTTHMEEAAEVRTEGKEENVRAAHEAKKAQEALAKAIAVLEEFYKDSGKVPKEAWEFVQREPGVDLPAEPSTWEASYTGVADPTAQPDGIITVLKEVASDFSKMEADTLAQEATDKSAYEEDKNACTIEKARRAKESELKAEEQKRVLDRVSAMEKSKKHVGKQLESVEQYVKELGPACMDGDSTYEDRKAARQDEIEALKEAQGILKDAFKDKAAPAPAPAASFLAPVRPVSAWRI